MGETTEQYVRRAAEEALRIYDRCDAAGAFYYFEGRMRNDPSTAVVLFTCGTTSLTKAAVESRDAFERAMLDFMDQSPTTP